MAVPDPPTARPLIVSKSVHHQNTARIAHVMADVLGAECLSPDQCPYHMLGSCTLLGLGSGVFYGRVHADIWRWVQNLPEQYAATLPVFIFTTSGLPVLTKLWHWPLKSALTQKGYDVIAEFSCRGFDTWGPLWLTGGLNRKHPDTRDIQRVRDFADRIARLAG